VDKLAALSRPSESISDVIIRLAGSKYEPDVGVKNE
jgi:hypothetical protein